MCLTAENLSQTSSDGPLEAPLLGFVLVGSITCIWRGRHGSFRRNLSTSFGFCCYCFFIFFFLLGTSYILELNEESKSYKQVSFHSFDQLFHILFISLIPMRGPRHGKRFYFVLSINSSLGARGLPCHLSYWFLS